MNASEFTASLKTYYGHAYTEFERQVIGPWLVRFERNGGSFSALFDAVTEQVSKAFGKLPDKAQLATAAKSIRVPELEGMYLPAPMTVRQPLTEVEQAQVEEMLDLTKLIPGYKPTGAVFGPSKKSNPENTLKAFIQGNGKNLRDFGESA